MTTRYDADDSTTWTYTFDAENRLVVADDGTTITTYIYDAGGKRVIRSVDDATNVTDTVYVAGMEIELVDGSESQRTIYYGMGGAFRIVGGADEGLYFRHTDHLGSTSVLSNENGDKVAGSDVLFAPFGEVRTGDLSELTDRGYTGQKLDRSADGLMYYNARYYLPELRRFISADTIVPNPVDPQALNRFSYVINNPLGMTDPTGHYYAPSCPAGLSDYECGSIPEPTRGNTGSSYYGARSMCNNGLLPADDCSQIPQPVDPILPEPPATNNNVSRAGNGRTGPEGPTRHDSNRWVATGSYYQSEAYIEDYWIAVLRSQGGTRGERLANWYDRQDVQITFTYGTPVAQAIGNSEILVNPDLLPYASVGGTPLLEVVGAFGHEIRHLRQYPILNGTLRGEVRAYNVQHQIYEAMGVDPAESSYANVALIGSELVGSSNAQVEAVLGPSYVGMPTGHPGKMGQGAKVAWAVWSYISQGVGELWEQTYH